MVEPIVVSSEMLDKEIDKLKELCGDDILIQADKAIKIQISITELKTCTLSFKFTTDDNGQIKYPNVKAHFELKSNNMPEKLT